MRREATWTAIAAVASALALCGTVVGLAPLWVTIIAFAAWMPFAARRLGPALGSGSVVVGWAAILFVSTVLSHLGVPASIVAAASLSAATMALPWLARAYPANDPDNRRIRDLGIAMVAPAVWLLSLAWGTLSPGGAGLSWAMHKDSTMNVWGLRRMLLAGGLDSFVAGANIQPLQDALGLALTPADAGNSASPHDTYAAMVGYASLWAVLVAITCGAAAMVVVGATSRSRRAPWWAVAASVATGLAMLASPASGVLIDYGQINGHVVLALVLASVLAARGARTAPLLAMGALLTAAGLLVACWGPFAAVPGVLALTVAWARRKALTALLNSRPSRRAAPLFVGVLFASVCGVVWGYPLLASTVPAAVSPPDGGSTLQAVTFSRPGHWESYTNPAWLPLTAITFVAIALTWATAARARSGRDEALAGTTMLAIAMAIVVASRAPVDALPYFPAKALWLATLAALPLAVAVAVRGFSSTTTRRRWAAAFSSALIVAGLVAAPVPSGVSRWGNVAFDVATGHHVGTRAHVAVRVLEWSSDDELVLPWRLDSADDTTVALMASAFAPSIPLAEFDRTRYVLRYYRNDFSAEVACLLAAADLRRVRLVTTDPLLGAEIEGLCPDAGIAVEFAAHWEDDTAS